jgi:translation initiation factor 2B subunit (eIF-2B alpha/beta/delta family)
MVVDDAINQIASDINSGAAEILLHAGAVFTLLKDRVSQDREDNFQFAQQTIIETCIALARAQPDMSPLLRLANEALSAAQTATDARLTFKRAEDAALAFIAKAHRAAHAAAAHSATLIRDNVTVLTHSRSSTVLAAFAEAKRAGRIFSVVATESRPMLEGRELAESLAGQDIPVTVIADAAVALAMDSVDLVMVGADRITPLDLVNKIGTRMIALATRERGLPLYALCDSSKFISKNYLGFSTDHQSRGEELWPNAPTGVEVINRYFEPTPLAHFTGIVTDDGLLSSESAASLAENASIDSVLVGALAVSQKRIK